jgi:hypothetical protein
VAAPGRPSAAPMPTAWQLAQHPPGLTAVRRSAGPLADCADGVVPPSGCLLCRRRQGLCRGNLVPTAAVGTGVGRWHVRLCRRLPAIGSSTGSRSASDADATSTSDATASRSKKATSQTAGHAATSDAASFVARPEFTHMPEHSAGISTATSRSWIPPSRLPPPWGRTAPARIRRAPPRLYPATSSRGYETTVERPVRNLPSSLSTYMNEHN